MKRPADAIATIGFLAVLVLVAVALHLFGSGIEAVSAETRRTDEGRFDIAGRLGGFLVIDRLTNIVYLCSGGILDGISCNQQGDLEELIP